MLGWGLFFSIQSKKVDFTQNFTPNMTWTLEIILLSFSAISLCWVILANDKENRHGPNLTKVLFSFLLLSTWARDKWPPCCSVLILFCNLEKTFLLFGQIYFIFWTIIFHIFVEYILYVGQMHVVYCSSSCYCARVRWPARWLEGLLILYLAAGTNIFDHLNKYIWSSEQIYLIIWTNMFLNYDKYAS